MTEEEPWSVKDTIPLPKARWGDDAPPGVTIWFMQVGSENVICTVVWPAGWPMPSAGDTVQLQRDDGLTGHEPWIIGKLEWRPLGRYVVVRVKPPL